MLTKDSAKWNFEMLQELIEGPLLNPKRLEEAIKVARFMRRLLSFFHPFTHRFSELPRKQVFYCPIPDLHADRKSQA
jgi:large subunit ribosomal protein L17e